jgi:hypothetical protein
MKLGRFILKKKQKHGHGKKRGYCDMRVEKQIQGQKCAVKGGRNKTK